MTINPGMNVLFALTVSYQQYSLCVRYDIDVPTYSLQVIKGEPTVASPVVCATQLLDGVGYSPDTFPTYVAGKLAALNSALSTYFTTTGGTPMATTFHDAFTQWAYSLTAVVTNNIPQVVTK